MILEEATYEKFGYYPSELTQGSDKKVLAKCDDCGEVRVIRKRFYRALCALCAKKSEYISEETRKRMREATKGERNPMFGKKGINNPNYGRKHTEEAKRKIRDGNATPTEETRRIKSEAAKRIWEEKKRADTNISWRMLEDAPLLSQMYWKEYLSACAIAKQVGCSESAVYRAMRKYEIPSRSLHDSSILKKKKHPILWDRAWLYEKYWDDGLSQRGIAEIIGCHVSAVENAFARFSIPARDSSEVKKGKRNPFFN